MLGWVIVYSLWATGNYIKTKERAFAKAKMLAGSKGIINLGAGPHRHPAAQSQRIAEAPEVRANLDIVPDSMPNFILHDIEKGLPYGNKQFGCAFASHVLEHLDNWKAALREMVRVADYVVIVLPHPLSIGSYLPPGHKHYFSFTDMRAMEKQFPNVEVYA